MEMKVIIDSLGLSVPKTGFGLNLFSGSYIEFRNSKKTPKILMGLKDIISLGSKSGTVVLGHIATEWFFVDPIKNSWVTNSGALIGKKAEIEVIGSIIAKGKVDLKFTVYDKDGNTNELISKVDIKSSGFQVANTKVRGILVKVK